MPALHPPPPPPLRAAAQIPPPSSPLPPPGSRLGRAGSGRAAAGRGRILRRYRAPCPAPPGSPRVRGTAGGTAAPGQPAPQQRRDEWRRCGRSPGSGDAPLGTDGRLGRRAHCPWAGKGTEHPRRAGIPAGSLGWPAPAPAGGGRGFGGVRGCRGRAPTDSPRQGAGWALAATPGSRQTRGCSGQGGSGLMPWRWRWEWVSASMARCRASFGLEMGGKLSFVFGKPDCLLGSVSSLSFSCLTIQISTLTTSCRI